MEVSELLGLVRQGESDQLEFKQRLPNDEEFARLLIGFANAAGGVLILGVADNGEVVGLSDSRLGIASVRVRNVADQLLPEPVRMEAVTVDGLTVLVVHVPAAPEHLRPVRTASGEVFVRQGDHLLRHEAEPFFHPPAEAAAISLFVAMSFHFEEDPALVDYFEAIKRSVKTTGLPIEVVRMDLEEGDFEVSAEINERILRCDALLADFTLNSPNVYFEAGVARGAGKYTIRTARRGTELPFDLGTWKTLLYANATQLEAALVGPLRAAYHSVTSSGSTSP